MRDLIEYDGDRIGYTMIYHYLYISIYIYIFTYIRTYIHPSNGGMTIIVFQDFHQIWDAYLDIHVFFLSFSPLKCNDKRGEVRVLVATDLASRPFGDIRVMRNWPGPMKWKSILETSTMRI